MSYRQVSNVFTCQMFVKCFHGCLTATKSESVTLCHKSWLPSPSGSSLGAGCDHQRGSLRPRTPTRANSTHPPDTQTAHLRCAGISGDSGEPFCPDSKSSAFEHFGRYENQRILRTEPSLYAALAPRRWVPAEPFFLAITGNVNPPRSA